jgi:hypothetical protein
MVSTIIEIDASGKLTSGLMLFEVPDLNNFLALVIVLAHDVKLIVHSQKSFTARSNRSSCDRATVGTLPGNRLG